MEPLHAGFTPGHQGKFMRIGLWLMLTVAFVLRLSAFREVSRAPEGFMVGDGFFYHVLAKNILQGRYQITPENTPDEEYGEYEGHLTKGYIFHIVSLDQPTNYWSPGYPAMLAIVYAVFGVRPWIASLLGCLLGTSCCFLLWKIASRIAGPRCALIVASLWAVHPVAVRSSARLETETPALTLLLLLVFLSLLWRRPDGSLSLGRSLAMGILGGLLFLVRSTMALWIVALAVSLLLERTKHSMITAVALLAAFTATIVPWGFRNQASLGKFMLLETRSAQVFYGELSGQMRVPHRFAEMKGVTESQRWQEMKQMSWELIRSQPRLIWRPAWHNAKTGLFPLGNHWHAVFYLGDVIMILSVLAGINLLRTSWRKFLPMLLFLFLYFVFVLLLLKGYESRFRMMSDWIGLIFAAAFLYQLFDSILKRMNFRPLGPTGR